MKAATGLWVVLLPVAALAAEKGQSFSPDALVRYKDAVAKVSAGQHGPATDILNGLAADYPRIPELFVTRCSAQLGLRHAAAAEADCAYALAIRPGLPSALYGLATAEDSQGKVDLAVAHYRQYAALDDPQALYKAQAQTRANQLAGQAGALPVPPPPPPPAGSGSAGAPPLVASQGPLGTLLVYRNHMIAGTRSGGFHNVSLYLNNQLVGPIGHDQYVEIQIGAGNHMLEARFAAEHIFEIPRVISLPIDVTPNGQTYINFDHVRGQLQLVRMSVEQGRKEIKEDCQKAYTRRL